jgi:hypothetical protein
MFHPWRMCQLFVLHSSTLLFCLESLRNRTPSNLKLYHINKNQL